jgi:hypothetical protein
MGTVRYMSPEQVRGRPLDARSDLYSLGVTLYEGLAGRTPFDGDNQFAIMEQHLHKRPPPLAEFGAEVPAELERVLQHSMEKKAEDRFADAGAFREALESLQRGERPARAALASASRARRGRRIVAAVVGFLVLGAGIGVGVHHYVDGGTKPQPVTTPAKPLGAVPSADGWLEPYSVSGVALGSDARDAHTKLRVQSVRELNAEENARVVASYASLVRELRVFLAGEPAVREALRGTVRPLNLVLVPDWVLGDPKRWPGFGVEAGHSYGSRYVATRETLFVSDGAGFLDHELPYGVALHLLAPIDALSNEAMNTLAERFAAQHLKNAAP